MNPVLLLVRDNFEMNKRCIDSIFEQDVPTTLVIVDNSERDDTLKWALDQRIAIYPFRPQIGVSRGWNFGIGQLFKDGWDHVLVPNSDTIIPPWFYRELLSCDVPFVTGISVDSMDAIKEPIPKQRLVERPDFSAFLIRRDCWETVGPFNEQLVHYCGDMDYHIRAHRLGIPLMNAGVRFYHERSSTLKLATPEEHKAIQLQADKDRATFRSIYGFGANDPQYEEVFKGKVSDA